ncbi:MAG: hypothetical protein JW871_06960 [Endomicrobiales bacterium]|nr:hypothetical protein [Endomicrobiales bacterium]
MKKVLFILLFFVFVLKLGGVESRAMGKKPDGKGGQGKVFYIYQDEGSPLNHFSPSGWMGDTGDLSIDGRWMDSPFSGQTCFRIEYTAKGPQGWAGIYWQEPANNWGDIPGGHNLSKANKFTMWIRGEKGGEKINGFTIGGILDGKVSSDTDIVSMNPLVLTEKWNKVEVPLEDKNLKNIISGLSFSISKENNPKGAVFYIDEVRFE